jgi:serine protease Do
MSKEVSMRVKPIYAAFLLVVAVAFSLPEPAPAAGTPDFVVLAQELKPAVVNISTAKTVRSRRPMLPGPRSPQQDFFDEFFDRFFQEQPQTPRRERSLGSGFVISADGYILTNDHVIDGADEIKVRLSDGRTFAASVKGVDAKLDLALLKIEAGDNLPVARLGDSGSLKVGEWVMAIGNPFGLEQTVTVGIVSAKGRVIGAGPYDDFIQTDASINPGNSGGPLFNTAGEVVGINTAIVASGQGIGFAIPINAAKIILTQLKETGQVTRGWLGVSVQVVTAELAESFGLKETKGALVAEVLKNSPAEKAGIKRGDIILTFDSHEVDALNDLPRLVAATQVGKAVKLTVFRDGKIRELNAVVGKLQEGEAEKAADAVPSSDLLGLKVADITPETARLYELRGAKGALITGVDPDGAAAEANLRPGDIILEVNSLQIADAASFRAAAAKARPGVVLRLLIQRGDGLLFTTVKVK